VNYGVNSNGFRKMVVPFKAKDVALERIEFGHPNMAIVLNLLLYTPRLLAGQEDILIDKERLNLPPVPVYIPRHVLAPLSLFAGTLYFQDAEEDTTFADFLGIIPRQGRSKKASTTRAFDEGKIARNGFVLPMHRSELMGMPATSVFQKRNPATEFGTEFVILLYDK
jgi:hypothetical protein